MDDVADDFIVGIMLWRSLRTAPFQQLFCFCNALRLKAIRSDLSIFDDGVGLIDFKRNLHATPRETGFFRGLELLPATEKELVRRNLRRDGLHLVYIN